MPPKKGKSAPFEPKEMVLAKMTGFPAWPSFVMPSDMIPDPILKAKKKTTNICVIFIPDGDFYWMNEKNLELLSPEKLQTKLSKVPKDKLKAKPKNKNTRTNNVTDAFIAANDLDFDEFMEDLAEKKKEADADDDDEVESEEEQALDNDEDEPSFQKNLKEADDDDDDPIEDDAEDEEEENDKNLRRSRSRTSERPVSKRRRNHLNGDSPSSKPESSDKESVEESDEIEEEALDEKAEEEVSGRKRPKRGSANNASSDNDAKNDSSAKNGKRNREESVPAREVFKEARSSTPKPMTEKDRQHQLWLCRIKLQRSLIQRNQPITPKDPKMFPPPTVDELSVARIILHRLADFPVSVEQLRETKIHKVLKCILKDPDLEYPDSFRLHEKCQELLDKWSDMIEQLKSSRHGRGNREESQAPDDSEVSGIETKRTPDVDYHEKVEA